MVLVSKHEMFKSNLASLLRQKERHFLEFDQFFYKIWIPQKSFGWFISLLPDLVKNRSLESLQKFLRADTCSEKKREFFYILIIRVLISKN